MQTSRAEHTGARSVTASLIRALDSYSLDPARVVSGRNPRPWGRGLSAVNPWFGDAVAWPIEPGTHNLGIPTARAG